MSTPVTVVVVPPTPIAIVPVGYGLQAPAGAGGAATISLDANNLLQRGEDGGLYVPTIAAVPVPSMVLARAVLAVPAAAQGYAEVVVVNADVRPESLVLAQLQGGFDAENDLEELSDSNMRVYAVPETGRVRFVLTGDGVFCGDYTVNYQLNL